MNTFLNSPLSKPSLDQTQAFTLETVWNSAQAAQYLRIHPRTLTRMARKQDIPAFQIGKHWRFRLKDLDAWMQSRVSFRTKL